jgi:hypothetical protein
LGAWSSLPFFVFVETPLLFTVDVIGFAAISLYGAGTPSHLPQCPLGFVHSGVFVHCKRQDFEDEAAAAPMAAAALTP